MLLRYIAFPEVRQSYETVARYITRSCFRPSQHYGEVLTLSWCLSLRACGARTVYTIYKTI